MKKIPHPWWHWFFTAWIETRSSGTYSWHKFACSKCNKIYSIDGEFNNYKLEEL